MDCSLYSSQIAEFVPGSASFFLVHSEEGPKTESKLHPLELPSPNLTLFGDSIFLPVL